MRVGVVPGSCRVFTLTGYTPVDCELLLLTFAVLL